MGQDHLFHPKLLGAMRWVRKRERERMLLLPPGSAHVTSSIFRNDAMNERENNVEKKRENLNDRRRTIAIHEI